MDAWSKHPWGKRGGDFDGAIWRNRGDNMDVDTDGGYAYLKRSYSNIIPFIIPLNMQFQLPLHRLLDISVIPAGRSLSLVRGARW